jgi:hypothetical protein
MPGCMTGVPVVAIFACKCAMEESLGQDNARCKYGMRMGV